MYLYLCTFKYKLHRIMYYYCSYEFFFFLFIVLVTAWNFIFDGTFKFEPAFFFFFFTTEETKSIIVVSHLFVAQRFFCFLNGALSLMKEKMDKCIMYVINEALKEQMIHCHSVCVCFVKHEELNVFYQIVIHIGCSIFFFFFYLWKVEVSINYNTGKFEHYTSTSDSYSVKLFS